MKKLLLLLLLTIPFANAELVIHQVLFDPLNEERGGEAVEIKNTGSKAVDVSGYTLATPSSQKDATFPEGSVVLPGRTFLVADSGWSEKRDDSNWKLADVEDAITLSNSGGFVELRSDNRTLDRVEWSKKVTPGNSIVRLNGELTEFPADFFEGIPLFLTSDVTLYAPALEVSEHVDLNPTGILRIANNGDNVVRLKLLMNDLRFKNYSISKSAMSIDGPEIITVQPMSTHETRIRLDAPRNVKPGRYASTLRVQVLDENS